MDLGLLSKIAAPAKFFKVPGIPLEARRVAEDMK